MRPLQEREQTHAADVSRDRFKDTVCCRTISFRLVLSLEMGIQMMLFGVTMCYTRPQASGVKLLLVFNIFIPICKPLHTSRDS